MEQEGARPIGALRCGTDAGGVDGWCDRVRVVLTMSGASVVVCDVSDVGGSAADVVDAIARLQLTARRCGGEIRLHGSSPALAALLRAVGLSGVLGLAPSGGEPVVGAEEGEQALVDEGVEPGDGAV